MGEGGWKDRREKKYNGMCTEFTKASNSYLFCISCVDPCLVVLATKEYGESDETLC